MSDETPLPTEEANLIKTKFKLDIKTKEHPRHTQYMGMQTMELGMERMRACMGLTEDEVESLFMSDKVDLDLMEKFRTEVKVDDLIGIEYTPLEVCEVSQEEITGDPNQRVVFGRPLTRHFLDGTLLDRVREEVQPVWLPAGYLTTQSKFGRLEILYRDDKPYGLPESVSHQAELVYFKDKDGNSSPILKVRKLKEGEEAVEEMGVPRTLGEETPKEEPPTKEPAAA